MKYLIGLIIGILVLVGGFFVGKGQRSTPQSSSEPSGVSIYYIKADGIYQISSDKEGEAKLLEGQFENLLSAREKLIVASGSALLVYDLVSGQSTMVEPVTDQVSLRSWAVSPDGTRVAYVKNIQVGDIGFKNELWLLDLSTADKQKLFQEPELGADPEGVYYILALNGWLDNQRLLVGRAYEGASFCPLKIGTDTKLPQQCSGYGLEQMGLSDRILATDNGAAYGVKRIWPEFGRPNDQTGLYRQTDVDKKEFISDDQVSSLVKSGEILFMTKLSDPKNFQPIQADLYSFNLTDETSKRLTHDATSVDTKENLRLSNNGRFLSWDSQEISTQKTRSWLYDLKLNQYYPLGDNTFSALVIEN